MAESLLPAPSLDPDAGATDPTPRTLIVAGGCFWCVEGVFERLAGVRDAESGYAGGSADTADYERVCSGATGHAEAVRITYDPTVITLGALLRVFFATHDPTTLNRQGNDVGSQYRSAIFWSDAGQREASMTYIAQLNTARVFAKPIVTTLEPLKAFYLAETYHQDFAQRNPGHPYIRAVSQPKIDKLCRLFPDQLR